MSRFFAFDRFNDSKIGDIVWSKRVHDGLPTRYIVRVGKRNTGEVWHMPDDDWDAICYGSTGDLLGRRMVRGFRTRWAATEYILDVAVRPVPTD